MYVKCETCAIRYSCDAYEEAAKDNENSYHPQNVIRVYESSCPLVKLIKEKK